MLPALMPSAAVSVIVRVPALWLIVPVESPPS
jgi:hypothetical protein